MCGVWRISVISVWNVVCVGVWVWYVFCGWLKYSKKSDLGCVCEGLLKYSRKSDLEPFSKALCIGKASKHMRSRAGLAIGKQSKSGQGKWLRVS